MDVLIELNKQLLGPLMKKEAGNFLLVKDGLLDENNL